MRPRTRSEETRYTMALGYAYGAKDFSPVSSNAGRRAMVTSSMDFAQWYAVQTINLEKGWEVFSALHPESQREMANKVKTLPYAATVTH